MLCYSRSTWTTSLHRLSGGARGCVARQVDGAYLNAHSSLYDIAFFFALFQRLGRWSPEMRIDASSVPKDETELQQLEKSLSGWERGSNHRTCRPLQKSEPHLLSPTFFSRSLLLFSTLSVGDLSRFGRCYPGMMEREKRPAVPIALSKAKLHTWRPCLLSLFQLGFLPPFSAAH